MYCNYRYNIEVNNFNYTKGDITCQRKRLYEKKT